MLDFMGDGLNDARLTIPEVAVTAVKVGSMNNHSHFRLTIPEVAVTAVGATELRSDPYEPPHDS